MIRVKIIDRDIKTSAGVYNYVDTLDEWKCWLNEHNLKYLPAGSSRDSIAPGQWFVKSYCHTKGIWRHRELCFHNDDKAVAMLFKLRWFNPDVRS